MLANTVVYRATARYYRTPFIEVTASTREAVLTVRTRALATLQEACKSSRQKIVEKFISNSVMPAEHPSCRAWGQYLEFRGKGGSSVSSQYGIYGTSAGIQVLTHANSPLYKEVVEAATNTLPLLKATPADGGLQKIHSRYVDKGDLCVVYKVAGIVDAYKPDQDDITGIPVAVEHLLALRRDGGGWPDFYRPGLEEFRNSTPHATAAALYSLGRFAEFRGTAACREALAWLAGGAVELDSLSISTISLISLAIDRVEGPSPDSQSVADLRKRCRDVLMSWAERSEPADVRRSLEALEYLLPQPSIEKPLGNQEQKFTFLLYLPHCLAALALLKDSGQKTFAVRRFLELVLSEVTGRILQRGAFVAAGRSLVSTVESLWIYRLLDAFESYAPSRSTTAALTDWLRIHVTARRWIAMIALTGTIGLAAVGVGSWASSLVVGTIVSFVTGIAAAVFVHDVLKRG